MDHATEPTRHGAAHRVSRIDAAVAPETVLALQLVIEREHVGLSEALRRLVAYGELVYRAIREEHAEVLVRTDRTVREVVLL
ncbi:hypothetical protein F0L68_20555 [Solihabitans fulvus]|uniref:Uncharacterized protein n=1 Tax=Solihabitans fulvus TaxID=1892852 RepID=A0A5B2XAZ2_9PSEU|nr:hypothetical protein [Solihabitans fulvus]KAA2260119.1 hypothetical protein F0L68_20555 [Solihabitans fulvus]